MQNYWQLINVVQLNKKWFTGRESFWSTPTFLRSGLPLFQQLAVSTTKYSCIALSLLLASYQIHAKRTSSRSVLSPSTLAFFQRYRHPWCHHRINLLEGHVTSQLFAPSTLFSMVDSSLPLLAQI
ncbi:hypothetical protein VN97_g3903 [Penicillium thymicola]|uniref:Uncharacterized protein n=1 Tax=Penicillium thymicola TaxID=293382 RepID=A0AAI9X9T9_PENTH|nr:hypothetical protein VN97_g3903 [Penicillium thymicola]